MSVFVQEKNGSDYCDLAGWKTTSNLKRILIWLDVFIFWILELVCMGSNYSINS
jgi:hypothetical protein